MNSRSKKLAYTFNKQHFVNAALFAAMALSGNSVLAEPFYRLESVVPLPKSQSPDWDYLALDAARSRLFIAQRGDGVTVYDLKTKKVLRTLDKSEDGGATTLVPEFDRGYTTNEDGSTTIFTLSSLKTIDRVKFGEDADSMFYEPVTKQLVAMMGDSKAMAFLDAKTGAVLGKLEMQSKKLDGAAPDGKGNLFVAERDRNSVAVIDVKQRTLKAEWKVDGCDEPTGLTFDSAHKRILIGCRGKSPVLAVMDSETGKVVGTFEIGHGNDGVAYDADTHRVFTSNGVDANLVIYNQVDPNTYKLIEATTTRPYARTMVLDPASKKVYTVTAEGTVDPSQKQNRGPAPFYPNKYFPGTFMLLTYSQR